MPFEDLSTSTGRVMNSLGNTNMVILKRQETQPKTVATTGVFPTDAATRSQPAKDKKGQIGSGKADKDKVMKDGTRQPAKGTAEKTAEKVDEKLKWRKPLSGEVLFEVDDNGERSTQPGPSQTKGKGPMPPQTQTTVEEVEMETLPETHETFPMPPVGDKTQTRATCFPTTKEDQPHSRQNYRWDGVCWS